MRKNHIKHFLGQGHVKDLSLLGNAPKANPCSEMNWTKSFEPLRPNSKSDDRGHRPPSAWTRNRPQSRG